jgi:hypothetical protein
MRQKGMLSIRYLFYKNGHYDLIYFKKYKEHAIPFFIESKITSYKYALYQNCLQFNAQCF